MIPLHLTISGFLSYRDPVELDFTSFDLACIAGANGAGKSSLLDAITWALFGQARRRDDSVINSQSEAAEVNLTFGYENNIYQVQRRKGRDKPGVLEFRILQSGDPFSNNGSTPVWKALTERMLRETETLIQRTLRMDFETFVNAAFFLQGKADQFTQQRPGDRKRILGSILGLEVWEQYRQRAVERRKSVEADMTTLDGRLHEIAAELGEEETRKGRLAVLEADLERLSVERCAQEAALVNIRKIAATLAEQRKLVAAFYRQHQAAANRMDELSARCAERQKERDAHARSLARAEQIEAAYEAWQRARQELERWDGTAAQFRQGEKRRQGPLDEINAARARLLQEARSLEGQKQGVEASLPEITNLQSQIENLHSAIEAAEAQLAQRAEQNNALQALKDQQSEANAENPVLKRQMDELKDRITRLKHASGGECPVCGQPLRPQEREALIEELEAQGREMGDRYRANGTLVKDLEAQMSVLKGEIARLDQAEGELRRHTGKLGQVTARLEALQAVQATWLDGGARRLEEIESSLETESFAPEARVQLAEVDAELKRIGYDAAAHDEVRRAEMAGRASEAEVRALERARAALAPIERELSGLEAQLAVLAEDVRRQETEVQEATAALAAAEAQAPDLEEAEALLDHLQERENRLRLDVGAARQKVLVLEDLKTRRQGLETRREELARLSGQLRQLERAFGKDGVPALLIEQALPEIEGRANEVLDRLSNGNMSVRFVTQTAYKEKHREDLRETLEIQISDGAGTRDYEMFSGGEAFRVNFAIRLALSEVLAQRAGARLQTLVIDEGFGSQDNEGRQRLLEAINLVRPDFAKILVITHIDELKDAFPNRIEVEKTERGSSVKVS